MGNREEESSRLEMWMVAFPGAGPIATSCNVTRSSPANTARNFAAAAGSGSKEMTRAFGMALPRHQGKLPPVRANVHHGAAIEPGKNPRMLHPGRNAVAQQPCPVIG